MKGLKKLLTGILAATMIMGASLSVCAAEDTTQATTGTITIKDAEANTTYDFYRILNLEAAGSDYTSVIYTINDGWDDFFSGDGSEYLVDTDTGNLNPIKVDGVTKYINITENNKVAFTNDAMAFALENENLKVTSSTSSKVEGLPLGYYLMIPVDASIKNGNSQGSVASITSTTPNAEIKVKATKPGIEKTDNKVSAEIGEVVTYTITGTVPNTAGYETYKYIISDEMTGGLTFQKDVKVTVEGTNFTESCDFTYSDAGFTVDIPVTSDALQALVGKEIVLTYTAVVNESAVEHSQEKNKAQLRYGHNPDQLEKGQPVEEEVYSTKITVDKHNAKDSTQKLAGAKFALMNQNGQYYNLKEADGQKKVEWVTVDGAPTSGTDTVTDAQAKALADAKTITTKTTDDGGAAEFIGLADGTYYLVEFEAPEGYNRLDTPTMVTVAGKDVDADLKQTENLAYAGQTDFDTNGNDEAIVPVANSTGVTLPETGGIGTRIFYIVGAVLVVAGVAYFILRRKADAE